MTEQKIEKILIDECAAALADANVDGIQILGAWQANAETTDDVKGLEQKFARGYLSVKVSPIAFETFTSTEGYFSVRLELNIRAERDAKGVDYLAVTEALTDLVNNWQLDFDAGVTSFTIPDEFLYSGFRLDGGDCGLNTENRTWTWLQTFTIQGVYTK